MSDNAIANLVQRLREKIIADAFADGVIRDGRLADRLIRERADAADELERLTRELEEARKDQARWEHGFEVYEVRGEWNDDWLRVASGSGPDQATVMREAAHYAAQYAQDGPVAVFHTMRRRIDAAMSQEK